MQITVRTCHLHLPICQSAQTGRDGWSVFANHRGITHKDNITSKQVAVFLQKCFETWTTDFLFPLEDKLHTAVHQPLAYQVLEGFDLNHCLSFVIICTTSIEATIADRRFKRFRVPEFQGFCWHNIVMRIYQYRRYILTFHLHRRVLGIHKGIALRWHYLRVLRTCLQ